MVDEQKRIDEGMSDKRTLSVNRASYQMLNDLRIELHCKSWNELFVKVVPMFMDIKLIIENVLQENLNDKLIMQLNNNVDLKAILRVSKENNEMLYALMETKKLLHQRSNEGD